jgi:hypothetical protein
VKVSDEPHLCSIGSAFIVGLFDDDDISLLSPLFSLLESVSLFNLDFLEGFWF